MKSSEELRWGSRGSPAWSWGTPCLQDDALGRPPQGAGSHAERTAGRGDTGAPGCDPALPPPCQGAAPPERGRAHTEAVHFHREGSTAVFCEDLVERTDSACGSSLPP